MGHFISDQTQYIVMNGQHSDCLELRYEVPKGAVLGSIISGCNLAVGTHLYEAFSTSEFFFTNFSKIESSVTRIKNWIVMNKRQFNLDYTECQLLDSKDEKYSSPVNRIDIGNDPMPFEPKKEKPKQINNKKTTTNTQTIKTTKTWEFILTINYL